MSAPQENMAEEKPQVTVQADGEHHHSSPRDSKGWDGKLRVERRPVVVNPDAASDPEYSDEENVLPGEQISADEDLLDDEPSDTEDIDCIHMRVGSIPSLHLERFKNLKRLCLRQNAITEIEGLSSLGGTLEELDLYDNLISHIRGLEELTTLTSLDLSFNKIKHIKRVNHLKELVNLYFVQNKISTIEGLEGLTKVKNLELAANRIREIQNLDTLRGLEELWLGKNKITELKGLSSLSNLRILSIQSNRIRSLTGLEELENLEELYISHNAITELKGLEKNHKLRVLDISNNQVSSVADLAHLTELEELWASYNQIGDFAEVERVFGKQMNLQTVYFEGNPLQLRQPALYRNKVRLAIPHIRQIDATYLR